MSESKTAIVTGAGSGVGRQAAVLLSQAGYALVLVGRTESKLRQTASELGEAPSLVLAADLCDPSVGQSVVQRTVERFGRIDALANVAGLAQVCPIAKITPEEWRRTIDTNVTSVMLLTSAAWPVMTRQRSGVIVNVSSMASLSPFPGFSMYAPAKAALNMFTLVTAQEGKRAGIKAVALAPGAIETPMLRSLFDAKAIPPEKTLDPVEVAGVVRDCVTGARAFQSGEVIQLPSP